jgi:hypothetical protein
MADLKLTLTGEDRASPAFKSAAESATELSNAAKQLSEAAEALKGSTKGAGDATDEAAEKAAKATEKWREIGEVLKKGAELTWELTKKTVELSEEQAKADRQLKLVAGDMTDAFKAQASAMQEQLGVSDDMVQRMQLILLRFGEAPAAIDKTVRALLDYSAATGVDAVSATETLTSNVETGRKAFKELGLQYDSTGLRSKDLEAITGALAKKIGGAAQADAESLTGAFAKMKEQISEVGETVGGHITKLVQRTGVVEKLTYAFKSWNTVLGGDDAYNKLKEREKLYDELRAIDEKMASGRTRGFSDDDLDQRLLSTRKSDIEVKLGVMQAEVNAANGMSQALPSSSSAPQQTAKYAELQKAAKEHADEMLKISQKNAEDMRRLQKSEDALDAAEAEKDAKALANVQEGIFRDAEFDGWEKVREQSKKQQKEDFADLMKANDLMVKQIRDREEEWKKAGEQLGAAFGNALVSAVDQLASGGKMDLGGILAGILQTAGSVLGGVLGSVVPGLGTALGATIGGTLGGLAGAGVKAATRTYHDGGWVDAPRHHTGAWISPDEQRAILQHGERVLSRREVHDMGGPAGVDAAAKGGSGGTGVTVHVNAFDGSSVRDFFERAGGRAVFDAVRTGRGPMSALLGGR